MPGSMSQGCRVGIWQAPATFLHCPLTCSHLVRVSYVEGDERLHDHAQQEKYTTMFGQHMDKEFIHVRALRNIHSVKILLTFVASCIPYARLRDQEGVSRLLWSVVYDKCTRLRLLRVLWYFLTNFTPRRN
jgi:hypothetical protein